MSQTRQNPSTKNEDAIAVRSLALNYPSGFRLGSHCHDWHQLIYAAQGVLKVETPADAWIIPCNRGVWVSARTQHSMVMTGTVALRTLYFRPDHQAPFPHCQAIHISPLMRELILHIVEMGYLRANQPVHKRLIGVLMDQIQTLDLLPFQLPKPQDPRALCLARHFQDYPDDPRSLALLAPQTGASQRTLERLFLKETGMTCGRWRQQCRLLNAITKLASGTSVTEVGLAMGYQSTSAFIAMFRAALGVTPGKYFSD